MEKITITEALSEIQLISKKVAKKQQDMLGMLIRATHVKDPFEPEGGSYKHNDQEAQAIRDLYKRTVKIRSAISTANINNSLKIKDEEKTIFEWLAWKREVATPFLAFVKAVYSNTKNALDASAQRPAVIKEETTGATKLVEHVANVDYPKWLKEYEDTQEKLDKLDGLLSLKNATIVVEI